MENKIQLSKDEIIIGFVASCIEDVCTVQARESVYVKL